HPIMRFAAVPESVEIHVIDRPGQPFLGTGEAAQGPAAAALANAIADATGARLRDLPLTADRIKRAIGGWSEALLSLTAWALRRVGPSPPASCAPLRPSSGAPPAAFAASPRTPWGRWEVPRWPWRNRPAGSDSSPPGRAG